MQTENDPFCAPGLDDVPAGLLFQENTQAGIGRSNNRLAYRQWAAYLLLQKLLGRLPNPIKTSILAESRPSIFWC